jgi:hypothetical protein
MPLLAGPSVKHGEDELPPVLPWGSLDLPKDLIVSRGVALVTRHATVKSSKPVH